MTLEEFKIRWFRSKINPILFYIPVSKKKPVLKATFKIKPLTYIEKVMVIPDSKIDFAYEAFSVKTENPEVTGKLTYNGVWGGQNDQDVQKNNGCKYRLYRKDGSRYIAVTENGEDDEKERYPLLANLVTVKLPVGEYYYKEYISSAGDELYFDTPKILVFQKTPDWVDPYPEGYVLKDYPLDKTPTDSKTLYIRYTNQLTGDIRETYSGYNGYNKETEESQGDIFAFEIHHKPKLIRTYVTYQIVAETTPNASFDKEVKLADGGWWPWYNQYAFDDFGGDVNIGDNFIDSTVYKVIPHISKIDFMGKNITEICGITETSMKRKDTVTYGYRGIIRRTGPATYLAEQYKFTFSNDLAEKRITIMNVNVCRGYYLAYSLYGRNFPIVAGDFYDEEETEYYYNPYKKISEVQSFGRAPESLTVLNDSGFIEPTDYLTISRNSWTRQEDETTHKLLKSGEVKFTPVQSEIDKRLDFNDSIVEIEITTAEQPEGTLTGIVSKDAILWSHFPYVYSPTHEEDGGEWVQNPETQMGENDYYKAVFKTGWGNENKVKHVGGYVSEEDSSHMVMWCCQAISELDPDNPDGFSLMFAYPEAPALFRMTLYEDNAQNIKRVITQNFTWEDNVTVDNSTVVLKGKQISLNKRHKYFIDNEARESFRDEGIETGCGAAVVFNRTSRPNYRSWHEIEEPLFTSISDERTYNVDKD